MGTLSHEGGVKPLFIYDTVVSGVPCHLGRRVRGTFFILSYTCVCGTFFILSLYLGVFFLGGREGGRGGRGHLLI